MRILMVGDVMGRTGRLCLRDMLQKVRENYRIDFTIANGENAAGGAGITRKLADELFSYGVDLVTMGNHVWGNKELARIIDQEERIIRPANYPPGSPGRGSGLFPVGGSLLGVVNLCGVVFMPYLDCPFRTALREVELLRQETDLILVDFHGEATSEKAALAWYLQGKVSGVLGTHTHVQTADERVLEGHTAFISDVGMTGPVDGIIGVKKELVIEKFVTQMPVKFEVSRSPRAQFNGAVVEIEESSGRALAIERIIDYHEI